MKKTTKLLLILFIGLWINAPIFGQYINYAEALQKSLYFYDAEKCGDGITGNRLEWRGDCHLEDAVMPLDEDYTNLSTSFISEYSAFLDPDGDGTIDLKGGYHDAGDHVQFGLPQTYASQTIEWALYEFPNSFKDVGEYEHMLELTKWASDYYLKCTYRDANDEIFAFCYQVGEGSLDHNYWGPPELQSPVTYPRYAYFSSAETPASDQCAGAAASLALSYINRIDVDADYANECLETAIDLYDFAVENRGLGYTGGFYNSSFDEDELALAAVWLYIATENYDYIEDIISQDATGINTGWLSKIIASEQDDWQNIWVHSWDTKWGGLFAKLAPITDNPNHWYIFRWNIEYWANIEHEDANDNSFIAQTPDGFSWIAGWGSARYNTAAQFCALVYCKHKDREDFRAWTKDQMDYIMGDNPLGMSYIVGYSDYYASHPHHRASHGSNTNSGEDPIDHKHVLWGALVGGPDFEDNHIDKTTDYIYNEVAVDYNAGFVGALAGHYYFHDEGSSPIENFPVLEDSVPEYFVIAKLEQENTQRTQITLSMNNATIHAPRIGSSIKVQYYVDLSEMIEGGQSPDELEVTVYYDQAELDGAAVVINGPIALDANAGIYYYEFIWEDATFYGDQDFQFALIAPIDSEWNYNWDPSNDFSRQGITEESDTTLYIPIFVDDEYYSGYFPSFDTILVSGLTLSSESLNLNLIGSTSTVSAVVSPTDATDQSVVWSSSDESIVTVSAAGMVTAISLGDASITATTNDGGYTASCAVSVTNDVIDIEGVTISSESISLYVNETSQLSATVLPENASNTSVSWSSSDASVASVSSAGLVTSIAEGEAVITVTTEDGGLTATATVSVSIQEAGDCDFDVPLATGLPTIHTSFTNYHIIGDGPDLSNVYDITINWDLDNNGLWQFSLNTNDGQPDWWIDLTAYLSHNFSDAEPTAIFSGTNIDGLDGEYYIALDGENFVMVETSGNSIIYLSNSATAPCDNLKFAASLSNSILGNVVVYPNPFNDKLSISCNEDEKILSISIYNSVGQVIFSKSDISDSSEASINFDGDSGLYMVQVKTTNNTHVKSVLKK